MQVCLQVQICWKFRKFFFLFSIKRLLRSRQWKTSFAKNADEKVKYLHKNPPMAIWKMLIFDFVSILHLKWANLPRMVHSLGNMCPENCSHQWVHPHHMQPINFRPCHRNSKRRMVMETSVKIAELLQHMSKCCCFFFHFLQTCFFILKTQQTFTINWQAFYKEKKTKIKRENMIWILIFMLGKQCFSNHKSR